MFDVANLGVNGNGVEWVEGESKRGVGRLVERELRKKKGYEEGGKNEGKDGRRGDINGKTESG